MAEGHEVTQDPFHVQPECHGHACGCCNGKQFYFVVVVVLYAPILMFGQAADECKYAIVYMFGIGCQCSREAVLHATQGLVRY